MAAKTPAPAPVTTYSASTAAAGADTSKAPALPDDLGNWVIPGSTTAAPKMSKSPAESAITELARFFKIDPKDANVEDEVVKALANHYGVDYEQQVEDITPNQPRPAGRGLPPTGTKATTGVPENPTAEVNTKALQEIAQKAGLTQNGMVTDPQNLMAEFAAQVTGPTGAAASATGSSAGVQVTAAEAYANVVKQLSNSKFKTEMAQYLEQGNFLNASANGGTPDTASIAKAYQDLLKSAQQGNTSVDTAYAANNAKANLPSGAPPTQTVSETAAFVQGMGEKLGVYLTPADITKISNMYEADVTSAAGGPTEIEDEIKNTVIQYFNPNDPRNPPGAASDMYQEVLQAANAYGIPVASADIANWVTNGIKNSAGDSYSIAQAATDTAAAATKTFQDQAAGLYPSLAPQIQAGQTVSNLIAPYNSITSELTGVPTTALSDPGSAPGGVTGQYYKFLQGGTAPAEGTKNASGATSPGMMTLDQWKQYVMSTPSYGFQNTQGGKNLASQFTSAILNEFGKVNTGSNQQGAFGNISPGSALAANTQ